jgi:hypothetical protein
MLLLAACQPEEVPVGTSDTRIDHNGGKAVESIAPDSCVSDDGSVHAVWQDDRDGVAAIWYNGSSDAGRTWRARDTQINDGAAAATSPQVACSADSVFVVWQDTRDSAYAYNNVYIDISTDNGRTWLEDDVLLDGDTEGDHDSLEPRILAVGERVYVAWFDNTDGAFDIWFQRSKNSGEKWLSAPSRVDTDTAGEAYSASPRIAADGDGRVVVVWEDARDGNSDVYANVSTDDGETWAASDTRLDGGDEVGANNSFLPQVSMSGDAVYAVWHDEREGEERDIFLNGSADGGDSWFAEAVRVDSDAEGTSDSIYPQVAADGDVVHVVWQDDRAGGYDVYHRRSTDGGQTFTDQESRMDTDQSGEAQSYNPVITAGDGTVLVGWEERRNDLDAVGFNDLYYNWSSNAGESFAAEDLRINSNEPGTSYAVDLNLMRFNKSLLAVWADGRFGSSDILFGTLQIGEASEYIPPETEEK